MEWTFRKDYRLLLLPILISLVILGAFLFDSYRLSLKIMIVSWTIFFLIYFYRSHVSRNLKSSVKKLRHYDDGFQVLDSGQWLKVDLEKGSLVSSWLLALKWQVTNEEKAMDRGSYSLVLFPSSLEKEEFAHLVRLLQ